MYTSKNTSTDVMKSIEGYDIFNSKFIYNIDHSGKDSYLVTKYEGRAELLANEIYGNYNNYGLLLITNRLSYKDINIGTILNYVPTIKLSSLR